MKLLTLAGQVCRAFTDHQATSLRTVQKVKNDHRRDVVTALDMKLHALSARFVAEYLPAYTLLSEESEQAEWTASRLRGGQFLVVDPLDGSSNYAMGLPHFGYMAARVNDGRLEGTLVVLPEHDQYLLMDGRRLLTSQPLPSPGDSRGAVYYAYPPKQDAAARQVRMDLLDLIDAESSGLYRSGSACVGLYQLLCGQHQAFFGHAIRIWDALAYLPMLAPQGVYLRYGFHGQSMYLLASRRHDLVEAAESILTRQGLRLNSYAPGDVLILDET
jgi:myo-inositol-1(or 4)-monophosphatase